MQLFTWLHRRVTGRNQTKCTPARRFRPQLEILEGREVPSTLTVTTIADGVPGSLRYEIGQAQSNDTIVFDKSLFFSQVQAGHNKHTIQTIRTPQTMILASGFGELVINKNLTIQGPGGGLLTIESQSWVDGALNSHWGSRIFEVDGAGTTVALTGLTITGGGGTRLGGGNTFSPNDGYGGAILNFGTMTISGCTLGGNTLIAFSLTSDDAVDGGAVANFGTMTLSGCDVSNNLASGYGNDLGGGIYNAGTASALTIIDCTFSSNRPDNIFGPYTDGGGNTFG